MISLLFIRHGATQGNLEKRYIGRTDEPLCETGKQQIFKLKEENLKSDYIYVSPMLRAVQTAQILFSDVKYIVEENLKETDFGVFEGKNSVELSGDFYYKKWVASMCKNPIPGGESVTAFKKRCCMAFEEIIRKTPDNSKTAFVVHGGVIMSILEEYAKPHRDFYDYHIKNGRYITAAADKASFEINNVRFL